MKPFITIIAILFSTQVTHLHAKSLLGESTIETRNGEVVMSDYYHANRQFHRRFEKDSVVLYASSSQLLNDGLAVDITQGHPSQLGSYTVKNGVLTVNDVNGNLIWTETLTSPICPPELGAEFIRAHWDELTEQGEPLRCVIPIIKAEKVAPVKWQRLKDNDNNQRVVELSAGSFGMRFFLSPTRFTFNESGDQWLGQDGQFESTRNPEKWPRYLKGESSFESPRNVLLWDKGHFVEGVSANE